MNWNKTVKTQMIAAGTMTLLGICVCTYSQSYLSAYDITEIIEKHEEAYQPVPVKMRQATPETAVKEEPLGFQASLTAFNLAFLYPDANSSSLGTRLVEALLKAESDWLSSIYELTVSNPENLAASLGMETEAYKNISWNKVEIAFYDENNNLITAKSNIQEIISMANTYFYYSAPEDYASFLAYASNLFESSHSVQYSVSDVYYCDGSLEQEKSEDDDDLSEDLVPSKRQGSLESGGLNEGSGVQKGMTERPGGSAASSAKDPGEASVKESEIPAVTDPSVSLEGAVSTEGIPEHTGTATVSDGSSQASQTAQSGSQADQSPQDSGGGENGAVSQGKTEQSTGETEEIGPGIALMESMASEASLETGAITETSEPVAQFCPGHADLHITAVISGLSNSEKGLFALDSAGREEAGKGRWMGWTDENKNYALQLAAQDWEEVYGFTMSPAFIMSPLSSEEINWYMRNLPETISEERKTLIRYALSSVGRVPYYWGGKPASSGYDGNHFGSLITPDRKGRSMRGLDCSGWINWVYWSALGKRLPYQGTGGLSSCGTAVNREDLQPGDIILKTGSEAHVVMFLQWEEDGTMKVIHESSAAVNNVTISTMTAQWPYYRKLID